MRKAKATNSGRGVRRNGRSAKPGRFVKLDHWVLESAAYRSLPCTARSLLIELLRRYNGFNNGRLALSVRDAAATLNVARNTASGAFDLLVERGFVRLVRDSSFHLKSRMAREWALTLYGVGDQPATKDFARWTPQPESKGQGQKTAQTVPIRATDRPELLPDGAVVCDQTGRPLTRTGSNQGTHLNTRGGLERRE